MQTWFITSFDLLNFKMRKWKCHSLRGSKCNGQKDSWGSILTHQSDVFSGGSCALAVDCSLQCAVGHISTSRNIAGLSTKLEIWPAPSGWAHLCQCQILTVLSKLPEARERPSGLKATVVMVSEWAFNVFTARPELTCHTRTVAS